MDKKLIVGVIVAVLAIGGIGAMVVLSGKDDTATKTAGTSPVNKTADSASTAQSSTPESKPTEQNNPANPTNAVNIENFNFSPIAITIKKGTTVTWTNKDSVSHTVTADSGQTGPDSELFGQGKTYSFTYNAVGTFTYHCKPHPNMDGTVIVTE